MTKAPWCDEGAFANPSYNLAFLGKMSANVINPSGHFLNANLQGIQQRFYIVVPNHLVALAAWFKVFGFSLFAMRAYSILWGAFSLVALFYIVRKLLPVNGLAQLATLLTAIDFVYLWSSADGRMESTANALALGSIASYLYFRERNFGRAVWVSQLLSAAAVFTHPNAILVQLILAVIVWRFDRAQIRWKHLVLAVIPYGFFGSLWLVYIVQSPHDFVAQFFSNAAGRNSSRWKTIVQPWLAVWKEFVREVAVYVAGGLWGGVLNKWLVLIPVFYATALIAFFRSQKTAQSRTFQWCLVALVLGMTLLNGFKAPMYMIYLLPFYNVVLALGFICLWHAGIDGKVFAAAAMSGLVALQILASVEHIRADEYHRDYLPAIADLKLERSQGKSMVGTVALGFGLGFTGFQDDWRLGEYSHLKPDVLVLDRSYRDFASRFEKDEPQVFLHIVSTLTTNYELKKRFGTFWIFERVSNPTGRELLDVKDIAMKEKGKQAEYLFEQIERAADKAAAKTSEDTSTHAAFRHP
ncbi:MAG TPA: glycosyltransferase family 39 protein [Bryobacteraceae bacterium]